MLKKLGIKKQYLQLLALRLPFEAVRNLINALFLKQAFEAIEALNFVRLGVVCGLFLAANLLLFTYNGTVWRFFAAFYAGLQKKLKLYIFNKLLAKPIEEIDKLASGDVLLRINQDAQMTAAIYGEPWNLVFLVNGIANLILSAILFCVFDLKLFLIVLAFVIPHILIITWIVSPRLSSIQNKIQKASADLTDMYESFVNLADTVFLYDCSDFFLKKIKIKNLELKLLFIKKALYKAIEHAVMPLFGIMGYLVLMFLGAEKINAGIITLGSLLYAFQLRGGVIMAANMIATSITTISVNKAGLKRLEEL
jgi:ABC-type bacteriocin/lantibiotic exporter with double-glycine peptidase domain